MGWNTDIFVTNQCRLCSIYDTLFDLITATNERCIVAGVAVLGTDVRLASIQAQAQAIHDKITTLIPLFIDIVNNDFSVTFTSVNQLTKYNITTVLQQIGDPARVLPSILYNGSEWALQAYKIINLLSLYLAIDATVYIDSSEYKRSVSPINIEDLFDTYGDAVSNAISTYNAFPWTSGTPFSSQVYKFSIGVFYSGYNKYDCALYRTRSLINYAIDNMSTTGLSFNVGLNIYDILGAQFDTELVSSPGDFLQLASGVLAYVDTASGSELCGDGAIPEVMPEPQPPAILSFQKGFSGTSPSYKMGFLSNPPTITYPFEYKDW